MQVGQLTGKNGPVVFVPQLVLLGQEQFEKFDGFAAVVQKPGQEAENGFNIAHGIGIGFVLGGDFAADENPERIGQQVAFRVLNRVGKQPFLLVEGQQAGGEIELPLRGLPFFTQVENLVFLAVAVFMEVFVGVVEQDAAAVLLDELVAFGRLTFAGGCQIIIAGGCLKGLAEGGGVFKGKAIFAKLVAPAHEFFAAGAAMAFVHQDQVVRFK